MKEDDQARFAYMCRLLWMVGYNGIIGGTVTLDMVNEICELSDYFSALEIV